MKPISSRLLLTPNFIVKRTVKIKLPVGPYETFAECVTAMQNKGYSKDSAGSICGKMEKQQNASTKTANSSGDKLYVRAFLIDDSLNINKWRVSRDSIPKNINTFIGKPLILYQNARMGFDHPDPFYGRPETLNHLLSYQESYRVGTIIDVTSKANPAIPGSKSYYAIIEVTHPDLKDSIRNNNIPVYVSPGIGELDTPTPTSSPEPAVNAAKVRKAFSSWEHCHSVMMNEYGDKEIADKVCGHLKSIGQANVQTAADYPWDECISDQMKKYGDKETAQRVCGSIKRDYGGSMASSEQLATGDLVNEWTGMHLAIVDQPAYGVKKAVINATCGGEKEACLLQLRNAHVQRYGAQNCGFCVKKAMQKYKIIQELGQVAPKIASAAPVTTQNTSQTQSNAAKRAVKMSQLEPVDSAANNNQTVSTKETVEIVERPNTVPNPQPQTRQPVQTQTTYTVPELLSKISTLSQENELLRIKNEELSNVKDTISERIAAMEMERRREKIERIITPDVIKEDKTRLEKIKYFTSSSIPVEQIEELYRDIKVTLRKASINNRGIGGRVPYGVSMQAAGLTTPTTSQTSSADVDEETGLTSLQKQLAVIRGGI